MRQMQRWKVSRQNDPQSAMLDSDIKNGFYGSDPVQHALAQLQKRLRES